jgi:hypothetical protein
MHRVIDTGLWAAVSWVLQATQKIKKIEKKQNKNSCAVKYEIILRGLQIFNAPVSGTLPSQKLQDHKHPV